MRIKVFTLVSFFILLIISAEADTLKKRPKEMQFIVNSKLISCSAIEYDSRGDVIKMTEYEQGIMIKYEKYIYDINGRLNLLEVYNADDSLHKTKKYTYGDSGAAIEERVFSIDNRLIEYSIFLYKDNRLSRVETFNPDKTMNRFVDYTYSGKTLKSMFFNSIGQYTMTTACVYDKEMLITGYTIDHSAFKGKGTAEVKVVYEEGPVTEKALDLIFR